ncbi:hypothetical protein ACLOJK_026648 [Asimina triloba]
MGGQVGRDREAGGREREGRQGCRERMKRTQGEGGEVGPHGEDAADSDAGGRERQGEETATTTGSAHRQEESRAGRRMKMELLTEGDGRRDEAGEMREGGGDSENRTMRIGKKDDGTTAPATIDKNQIADRQRGRREEDDDGRSEDDGSRSGSRMMGGRQ